MASRTSSIIKATHECDMHERSKHYLVCECADWTVTAKNFEALKKQICNVFEVPASHRLVLTYSDSEGDRISIIKVEDFQEALKQESLHPLRVQVGHESCISYVKVFHAGDYRTIIVEHRYGISYEEFQGVARDLFKVPISAQLLFTHRQGKCSEQYRTVANDEDLRAGIAEVWPKTLQLDVKVIRADLPYVVKAMRDGILHRLTLSRDEEGFSFETFRNGIRRRFDIPPSADVS
ncbi:unnamed protein product [Calypogeia fissa]